MNLVHLKIYQSRRFYLDEYPKQELLRKAWFQKRDNRYFINDVISWGEEETKTVNTNETYFFNRWHNVN